MKVKGAAVANKTSLRFIVNALEGIRQDAGIDDVHRAGKQELMGVILNTVFSSLSAYRWEPPDRFFIVHSTEGDSYRASHTPRPRCSRKS